MLAVVCGGISIAASARRLGDAVRRLRDSGAVVVVGTCPDFGVVTAIPQPLRGITRMLGLRLARYSSPTLALDVDGPAGLARYRALAPARPVRAVG